MISPGSPTTIIAAKSQTSIFSLIAIVTSTAFDASETISEAGIVVLRSSLQVALKVLTKTVISAV